MKKNIITLAMVMSLVISMFTIAGNVHAQNNLLWGGTEGTVQTSTGLGTSDPRLLAAQVVNVMLGFLGIIAVVIIMLGGFRWMTAMGNESKIDEAKKLLGAGVIGLVIILSSYGLAQFILSALYTATNAVG